MRVLVTGGAGFIGSHTVDALVARGDEVRVFDALRPPVHSDGARPTYLSKEAEFVPGDVRDRDALARALQGVDAVFHLAAYQDYRSDFSTYAMVNDVGTALLYEVIVAQRLSLRRVVVASSQAVYGEGQYRCPVHGEKLPPPRAEERLRRGLWEVPCPVCGVEMEPSPITEERVNPQNPYGVSKYAQELYALNLGRQWGIPTVALRYSITQGPRQSFLNAYSGVLRTFALRYMTGQPPVIYEDGRQLRDYVHVKDAVAANLLVLDALEAPGQVFNVGGGAPVTVRAYAELIREVVGATVEPRIPGIYRVGDSRHLFSDSSRLEALGWRRTASLRGIVEDYVQWLRQQPRLRETYSSAEAVMRSEDVLRQAMR
ncbi:MAG: NAD-dependent epimerase/dehydratase family protein [Chloroflexi bacterium]|nr:NAD-dependent epimerase/dehydratase family protein [Chloroflexota bacterium]